MYVWVGTTKPKVKPPNPAKVHSIHDNRVYEAKQRTLRKRLVEKKQKVARQRGLDSLEVSQASDTGSLKSTQSSEDQKAGKEAIKGKKRVGARSTTSAPRSRLTPGQFDPTQKLSTDVSVADLAALLNPKPKKASVAELKAALSSLLELVSAEVSAIADNQQVKLTAAFAEHKVYKKCVRARYVLDDLGDHISVVAELPTHAHSGLVGDSTEGVKFYVKPGDVGLREWRRWIYPMEKNELDQAIHQVQLNV